MSGTGDLAAFLAERYDEAEALARAAILHGSGKWATQAQYGPAYACIVDGEDITVYDEGGHTAEQAAFIAANDPAHRLADIKLKRAILADYARENAVDQGICGDPWDAGYGCALEAVLRRLGTEFQDQPGYRDEWRPGD